MVSLATCQTAVVWAGAGGKDGSLAGAARKLDCSSPSVSLVLDLMDFLCVEACVAYINCDAGAGERNGSLAGAVRKLDCSRPLLSLVPDYTAVSELALCQCFC